MQRRLTLALVTLTLLATVLAAAAFVSNSAPRVELARSPSAADHVTLYQNGLAEIRLHRTFDATSDETTLALPLPPGVLFESLAVEGEGIVIEQLRSALSQTSGIHAGDAVVVHIDQEAYTGTVQAIEGDSLALATDKGITYLSMSKATAIEVGSSIARPAATPGSLEASILVRAAPGEHALTVSYLAQGPGWTPSYRLDEDTGAIVYFATLTGLDDWGAIDLDLVAGAPHVVYTPRYGGPMFESPQTMGMTAKTSLAYDTSFTPSQPMGEMHRYHYAGAVTVARGEALRLVLAQGKLDIVRHYLEASAMTGCCGNPGDKQDVSVLERLRLRNTLSEPMAPGTLRIYKAGEWVGEDAVAATPIGEETNVTVSTAEDLKGRLTLLTHSASGSGDAYSYQLTVTNRKASAVDLRVVLEAQTYRTTIQSHAPEAGAEAQGTRVVWDTATLAPGATGTWSIGYETLRY